MTEKEEALAELYSTVAAAMPHALIQVQTLGNGEQVLVLNKHLYVWSLEDWHRLIHDDKMSRELTANRGM